MKILAFETSCDDTSVAIFENENLLAMDTKSQIKIHNQTSGVVPEVAAREHANSIFNVLENVLQKVNIKLEEIDYIGVTVTPGLLPSLMTGTTVASTISQVLNIPIIPINHIEAHIFSNFLEREEQEIKFPLACLTVSGGHNEIYILDSMWKKKRVGFSGDDAGGEAFDKAAKMMGLGYPGGPIISDLAKKWEEKISTSSIKETKELFPRVWLVKREHNFSFSGLKSAVKREVDLRIERNDKILNYLDKKVGNEYIHSSKKENFFDGFLLSQEGQKVGNDLKSFQNKYFQELKEKKEKGEILLTEDDKMEMSFEFENAITEVLAWKLVDAAKQNNLKTVMLAGGVSANTKLRQEIQSLATKNNLEFIFPKKITYCMDNAAMIGILTYYKIKYLQFEEKIGIVKH